MLGTDQTDKLLDASGNHLHRLKDGLEPMQDPMQDGLEPMQVDETKDKVYIYNLDQELSAIESEEERLIFLPDIDKKLGKIPKSVLASTEPSVTGSEMVLYNVPSSLSVPPENDKVRKAIIESRARAREKQVQGTRDSALAKVNEVQSIGHFSEHEEFNTFTDDAMDIG